MNWSILRQNADRVAAAALSVFGVLWVVAAANQSYFVDTPHVSLSFIPMAAGAILALLAGIVALSRSRPHALTEGLDDDTVDAGEPAAHGVLRAVLALVALVAYALVLDRVHALITTFGLMCVALYLSGEPLRPRLFVVAAIVAGLLYAMFVLWLGVPLPGSRFR